MKKNIFICCIFIFSMLLAGGVQAQGTKVAVGLGAASVPDYEGSDDNEGAPLLFIDARWENNMSVSIMGSGGRINLMPHPVFRAGVAMQYIGERDDDIDSKPVQLLGDVDDSFMVGGFLGFDYNRWNGTFEYMSDVADGNDGIMARLSFGYGMPINNSMTLGMGVFTTWADDDYMDAYFTVTSAGSAASGLNAYKTDSGIKDAGLNLSLHYTPWQNWGIMGIASYKRMLGDAEDSPVVDKEGGAGQATVGLLVTYRF